MSEKCRYVCELFVITHPKIPLFSPSQQPDDRDPTDRIFSTPLPEITANLHRNPVSYSLEIRENSP